MIKVQIDVDTDEMYVFAKVKGSFDVFDFVRAVADTVDLFCGFTMTEYEDSGIEFAISFDHKDKFEDMVHHVVSFNPDVVSRIKYGEIVKLSIW